MKKSVTCDISEAGMQVWLISWSKWCAVILTEQLVCCQVGCLSVVLSGWLSICGAVMLAVWMGDDMRAV